MQVTSAGGTSCASPIFASFIALVNDRLIAAGKPVLGFLNPLLYSTGKGGLDDVIVGRCFVSNGWELPLLLPLYFQGKAQDVRGPLGT